MHTSCQFSRLLALLLVAGVVVSFQPALRSLPRTPCRRAAASLTTTRITQAESAMEGSGQKKPLRVGFLIEPTPFTHVSGYSNRFQETLKYLKKGGDNVEIVTTDDTPNAPDSFLGYNIHYTPGLRFALYNHIVLTFDWKMVGLGVLKVFRPQIMHVATPGFFCIIAALYARLLRIPLVYSYHTHLPVYARNYLGWVPGIVGLAKLLIRVVHNFADLTLVTSPQMKLEVEEMGVKRVALWRKGIDTDKFHPKYRDEEMRTRLTDGHPEAPLLIYVGRLGAEKRLKDLRGILERIPGARLALVGTGPAEAELKEYFKDTNTVFTGVLRGEELSKAFASADIFLMPSDSETLGFVVLESMASGVPVVAANAGGIPDLIENGKTGYLVGVGDEDAYAARVKQLLDNPKFRQEAGVVARAEAERWGWEAATRELRDVHYSQAIANFRTRSLGGLLGVGTKTGWRNIRDKVLGVNQRPALATV